MLYPNWKNLPKWLRNSLLTGSVGAFHLMRLASECLTRSQEPTLREGGAPDASLIMLGRELLLAAWEDDPLNGQLAGQLVAIDDQAPWLNSECRRALQAVSAGFSKPENLKYLQRLAENGDVEKLCSYVDRERAKAPDNLFWLQQAVAVGDLYGNVEWALQHIDGEWPEGCSLVRGYLRGLSLLSLGRVEEAKLLFAAIAPEQPGEGRMMAATERTGHCLYLLGDREGAISLWRGVVASRPWHVNLLHRLHDIRMGFDAPSAPPNGSIAALFYSWNKAEELDAALASIAPSSGSLSRIVALNNGSTDATADVLSAWSDRMGDNLLTVELPVNVGAAAARNWLKNMPEVRDMDWLAYLDDDAILPPDWLDHMGRAVEAVPEASVFGGKILDHYSPYLVQSADLHLTMSRGTDEEVAATFSPALAKGVPFNVSDLHMQVTDAGRFDYIRPCISVTGCCHMFRTADMVNQKADGGVDEGNFSLFFSPSQYDDLEHDLRMARHGKFCCYTGFLPVRHMKRTGKATRMSAAQYGNGLGNKYKLHSLFEPEDILDLKEREAYLLEQDIENKLRTLDERIVM